MVTVSTDAGRIRHHVGDVVLLMDAVQQVCHGALGEDRHVLPAVGLVAQGHSGLRLVVVVSCGPEGTLAESLPRAWRCAAASLCPSQAGWNDPFYRRETETECVEDIPHRPQDSRLSLFSHRSLYSQPSEEKISYLD